MKINTRQDGRCWIMFVHPVFSYSRKNTVGSRKSIVICSIKCYDM